MQAMDDQVPNTQQQNTPFAQNRNNLKMVYTIVERGPGRSFWTRIGIATVNRDGSLNVRLDAIPTNGQMHVRDWEERDRDRDRDRDRRAALPPARDELRDTARELPEATPF